MQLNAELIIEGVVPGAKKKNKNKVSINNTGISKGYHYDIIMGILCNNRLLRWVF